MKQNRKKTLIWAIAVVFVAGAWLTGCSKTVRTVTLPAFFSKRMIEVALPVIRYDPQTDPCEFESESSLEQIKASVLEWDSEAWVDMRESGMFISSLNQDLQKWDYYYIYKPSSSNNNVYRISDLRTRYLGEAEDGSDYYLDFLLPVHMFNLEEHEGDMLFKNDVTYELVSGITLEDVYYFYGASGYYETEWEEERIILRRTYFFNQEEPDQEPNNYEIQTPIVINITTNDEKSFFSYTVEDVESDVGNREEDLIKSGLNEDQEERPAISREEALERTLSTVEKGRDEIQSREILYDTEDNPRYEMLIFSSGGYVIHMLDYAVIIEFSANDDKPYPYEAVTGGKKYYVGPGNDFYEENGQIISCQCQFDSEVRLEDFREEEAMILEYAIRMGDRITGYEEESGDFNIDEDEGTGEDEPESELEEE